MEKPHTLSTLVEPGSITPFVKEALAVHLYRNTIVEVREKVDEGI